MNNGTNGVHAVIAWVPRTPDPIVPFVDLQPAMKAATSGHHVLGGFRDNRGVKVAQCSQCLNYIFVHSKSKRIFGTVTSLPCPEPRIDKTLFKHCAWTPEDMEARQKRIEVAAQAAAGSVRKRKNRKIGG